MLYFEDNSEVVLTKVFLFSVKTLPVPFWLTYCMYSQYQTPPQCFLPRLHSLYTVQVTHYSSIKKKWSWSHALLLPTTHHFVKVVHELVQKERKKRVKRLFFSPLLLSWESEAPSKSLPPASIHGAPWSLQDTLLQTSLVFSHTAFLHTDNMRAREESRRHAEDETAPGSFWSVTTEQHQAASGNLWAQHFFTEEIQLLWPVEPKKKKKKREHTKQTTVRGSFVIKPWLLQSLIKSYF